MGSAMFDEGRLRSQRMADFSNMKAAFAHLSPVVPAVLAVAIAVSLTVFLLPGSGPQSGPAPLLSLGGASGRLAADLPPPARKRVPERVRPASSAAQLAVTRTALVPRLHPTVTRTHRVHRRSRARLVRRTAAAHTQVQRTAVPAAPVVPRRFFSSSKKTRGNGRGHDQSHRHGQEHGHGPGHDHRHSPASRAPRAHGHGHGVGHSSEHQGKGGGNGPRGGKK